MRKEKLMRNVKFEAAVLAGCIIIGITSVFSDMMPIAMATIFKIVSAVISIVVGGKAWDKLMVSWKALNQMPQRRHVLVDLRKGTIKETE